MSLTHLENEELIDAVSALGRSTASSVLACSTQRTLTQVTEAGWTLRLDDPQTRNLRQISSGYCAQVLAEAAFDVLNRIPLFYCDQPICNAVARRCADGSPYILMFSGMIDILTFRYGLNTLFGRIKGKFQARQRHELGELLHAAASLIHWFHLSEEAFDLPDFYALLDEEHRLQVMHGLGGAIAFVLMHEAAHVSLGHLDGARSTAPQLCSDLEFEGSTSWKSEEIDADRFAANAFRPPIRSAMMSSIAFVMETIGDLEVLCMPLPTTHPLILNRLHGFLQVAEVRDDPFFAGQLQKILEMKRLLMATRRTAFPNEAERGHLVRPQMLIDHLKTLIPPLEDGLRAVRTMEELYRE